MSQDKKAIASFALPQGGGALRGLGETFTPDLFTGTGNATVPLQLPAGRNGVQPALSLHHSTGRGNGPFGLGWALSLPAVSRATDRGLPRYDERDTFTLGGERLVALPGGLYRPRVEKDFSRIEHVEDVWQVTNQEGLITVYGTQRPEGAPADWRDPATVRDPADPPGGQRIFTWHPTRTEDPFGNRVEYLWERDRSGGPGDAWDVPYLSRVRYIDFDGGQFLVSVVFDWESRPDPYTDRRPGFLVRTTRRCKEIRVEVAGRPLRAWRLRYSEARNGSSLLTAVEQVGFDESGSSQALPPLTFGYSSFQPERRRFQSVDVSGLVPGRLDRPGCDLVDFHGRGLPDVVDLGELPPRVWRNLGDGRFAPPQDIAAAPAGLRPGDPGVTLLDFDGNGRLDLLVSQGALSGVFPLRATAAGGGGWDPRSFRPFSQAPSFAFDDPEVHLVDLDGDGAIDALRGGADAFECFFQDGRGGWGEVRRIPRAALAAFPNVSFADPRVRFADMTGDGLRDLVMVHGGGVSCWPALGRGKFGRRVEMGLGGGQRLPADVDPARLLLGDLDGDGCADFVYVESGRVRVWLNQGGERFAGPIVLEGTPTIVSGDGLRLVDLLGIGVAGLLWSRPRAVGGPHLFFLDLTGGAKPYLLDRLDAHLGAETRITYAPSTRFLLEDDKHPATRWRTVLPFPVQVVSRTEAIDTISRSRLTSEYRYHHGHWDGEEREFRGFGRVDRRDSQDFQGYHAADPANDFEEVPPEHFAPPQELRTWFHLGPVEEQAGNWRELAVSGEWTGDPAILERPRELEAFLVSLPPRARRDALRALAGQTLRTELYGLDGTARQGRPYTVTEELHGVSGLPGDRPAAERLPADPRSLDPGDWRLRVFFPHLLAKRTSQWERGEEPRVSGQFVEGHDAFGLPVAELAFALPRRRAEPALVGLTERRHAASATPFLAGRLVEEKTHELSGTAGLPLPELLAEARRLRRGETSRLTARLIAHRRCTYDGDAFRGLPLGQLGRFGALTRCEELALDAGQLKAAFTDKGVDVPPFLLGGTKPAGWPQEHWNSLADGAGYQREGDLFYAVPESRRYDFQVAGAIDPRGLLLAVQDPRGRTTTTEYDARYRLFPVKQTDPAGLTTEAFPNFHFLQLEKQVDPNGNGTRVTFTPLGLVGASFRFGKTPQEGDQSTPSTRFAYDLTRLPLAVTARQRLYHDADGDPAIPAERKDEEIVAVTFSDGFGRVVQTRTQAEPLLWGSGDLGTGPLDPDVDKPGGTDPLQPTTDAERVVVSGFKRYDNKGQVVEAAEPYFDRGLAWALPRRLGAVARTFYDPLGRPVRTVFSDGSEERVVFGVPPDRGGQPDLTDPGAFLPNPWEVYRYDAGDNAGRDDAGDAEARPQGQAARTASAVYADTPASTVFDPLGREIQKIERLGRQPADALVTMLRLDLQGNLLSQTDPRGRTATETLYDHQQRPLWTRSLDAGERWAVVDAAGTAVWSRDGRRALELHAPDAAGRPQRTWARDRNSEAITLRLVTTYGDEGIPDEATRRARREKNLLGRPHTQRDEAGLVTWEAYDFHGKVIKRTRRVIADAPLLAVFAGLPGPGGWEVQPYRVDWSRAGADLDLDAGVWTVETAFDALDRPKRLAWSGPPGAATVVPTFNRAGLPERLELDGEPVLERIAYNARGQRILWLTRTRGGAGKDLLTRCAYSARSFRQVRCRSEHCTVSGATITPRGDAFQDTGYLWDRAGNLAQILERAPGCGTPVGSGARPDALDRIFAYDALSRLVRATGRETDHLPPSPAPQDLLWDAAPHSDDPTRARVYTETYQYDAVGFLLELARSAVGVAERHVRTFTPGTGNRLASAAFTAGGTPVRVDYRYDARGQMEQEGGSRHCEWDRAGRLRVFRNQASAATEPTVYAQYLVGEGGLRLKKLVRKPGLYEVTVLFEGVLEHRYEIRSGGARREGYVVHLLDGDRRILARRGGETFDGKPAELLVVDDHLGSAVVEVDRATGLPVTREEYRPFGETSFGSYARKRYRFTGKERDEESGFAYHGARYYAPSLGRWLSPDPAGPVDGLNLYAYVRNNPMRLSDPTGRQAQGAPDERADNLTAQPAPAPTSPTTAAGSGKTSPPAPIPEDLRGTPLDTDEGRKLLEERGFRWDSLDENEKRLKEYRGAPFGEDAESGGKRTGTVMWWRGKPAVVLAPLETFAGLYTKDPKNLNPIVMALARIAQLGKHEHEELHRRDAVKLDLRPSPGEQNMQVSFKSTEASTSSEVAAYLEEALLMQELLNLSKPWPKDVSDRLERKRDFLLKQALGYKEKGQWTWQQLIQARQQSGLSSIRVLESIFGGRAQ